MNPDGGAGGAADLEIAGYTPFSTVDWPGRLAATVFLQGCPWRCTYCHNPALQDPRNPGVIAWAGIRDHLADRVGKLDGVVFSGGEPTRQGALLAGMREVKAMGFGVGLHSAGVYPGRLASVLSEVDWLGLDVKALAERYGSVTGVDAAGERAWRSLDIAIAWGGDLEVRVTVDPTIHDREHVLALLDALEARGAPPPVLQEVRAQGTTDEYAARLAGRTLASVIPAEVLPDVTRR